MNKYSIILIALISVCCSKKIEVIPGHAHNDYENESPLHGALTQGFMSVEVDIHLINEELLVSHDTPNQNAPTLESLYLKPLNEHILANKGFVYRGYSGPFFLMLDIKTEAEPTYRKLQQTLSEYSAILTVVEDGEYSKGPISILISGNRAKEAILDSNPKLAALDGRLNDLEKNIPVSSMPVISDNYTHYISWNGEGEFPEQDRKKLENLVRLTHAQNKQLRLWAAPDNPHAWKVLLNVGVDIINTDQLAEFQVFMSDYKKE